MGELSSSETRALLDPRTKMMLVLTIATICVAGGDSPLTLLAKTLLASVPCLLYLYERRFKAAIMYVVTFAVANFGGTALISQTYGVLNFIFVALFMVVARFMPGFVMGCNLISTTKISEFMEAMDRMHMPLAVSISLSVTFRFFPTLKEEYQSISKSMKVRGISFGGGKPSKMVEYRLIPMIISSMKISDELSAAALTRGLGAPKERTNLCEIGFRVQDILAILLCIFGWIMLLTDGFIV